MGLGLRMKRKWVAMVAVFRGVKDAYASSLYQVSYLLVLSFLKLIVVLGSRVFYSTSSTSYASLLPATSPIRAQVEQTRLELLRKGSWVFVKNVDLILWKDGN